MPVASHMQTAVVETMATAEGGRWGDDALGEEGEALGGLEGGTRRVLAHDAAVEQRTARTLHKQTLILAALAAHHQTGVIGGRRDQTEHLTRRGFDGHDTAPLALHQPLTQRLQLIVNGEGEVFAGDGTLVEAAIEIASFDAATGITQEYLHPLLTSQLFLIFALNAQFADIITRLVVLIFLDIGRRHLCDIAQKLGSHRILVLAHTTPLDIKAGEAVDLLLEDTEVFIGNLGEENLAGIG